MAAAYWAECASSYGAEYWITGTTYAVGDRARNTGDGEYYQCITQHTAGATFDASLWGRLRPFDRYVAFEQVEDDGTVLTPIGDFLWAYTAHPYLTTKGRTVPFVVSENGAQFATGSPGSVWIEFRLRRPVLAGEPFDAEATYAVGDQIYFTAGTEGLGVGDFYTAKAATAAGESPLTTPEKWDVVAIPYIFRGWLIQAGFADWLTSDGQGDKAGTAEGMASTWLDLEVDKLQRQGGQVRRMTWTR